MGTKRKEYLIHKRKEMLHSQIFIPVNAELCSSSMIVPVPDLFTLKWKKEEDINVRTSLDKKTFGITGFALLSSGLVLLSDCENCCVKMVNLTTRTVTSRLKLPDYTWGMCVLPGDQAAVTFPNISMIQLMSTTGGQFSCGKVIEASSGCCGIAYNNNRLYVSYTLNPPVEVMTLDGHIISALQTNDGKQLFKCLRYLIMSASTPPTLYVSDQNAHTVIQLSLDGKSLPEYNNKKLEHPQSVVAVDPGQLIVCGHNSHNVLLLTEGDGKMAEILGQKDGLTTPYSVSFCPYKRALVVGMYKHDSLNVFYAN
ncbi:uncharacterized protein LOC128244263 [Mya arenaria]|uniref:uncharacterized protein LOC128244263 n=1 Tax=Mya arenaria TaxID=6604 RepID=UPI0022DFD73D|nr:uncharacterized protein LOC128244263 [Mya arenaria]